MYHRAVDERPWPARDLAREGSSYDGARDRPGHPQGSGQTGVYRRVPRPVVGGGYHLRADVRRLGLLRFRAGRLQPPGRRLAGLYLAAHRPCPGRPEHGPVDPSARRPQHRRPGTPLRPRRAVRRDPLYRATCRGRRRRVGWKQGRLHDNAMAEAFNSLFKAELVRNRGPWKNIDDLEIAVAEYIDWFNFRRLHGEIGLVPPVEYETQHRSTTIPKQPAHRELEASIKPGT